MFKRNNFKNLYSTGRSINFQNLQEKAVELEADSILGEVRQKQTEASRMQQLLESLTTLRQARINKGASHGYMSAPIDDLHFSSTKSKWYFSTNGYFLVYFISDIVFIEYYSLQD